MKTGISLLRAGLFLAVWFIFSEAFGGAAVAAGPITPNQFKGSDSDRIEAAISAAKGTTNKIVIPPINAATGTDLWLIDRAILLPSDMTVILDNCTIQLSDQSRDNWFRSDNVGMGIKDPKWNRNIAIIGIGKAVLKGADHPRATGDYARPLVLEGFKGRVSYGADSGKEGLKQKGDWRNIGILMAYVDGFTARNFHIQDAHAWAISFERTHNAELSDLVIENHHYREIDGKTVYIANCDGINLRQGCKNFRINNISGVTGDDFIAITSLDMGPQYHGDGLDVSMLVTTRIYRGPIDDTENIHITNISCESACNGIAIRANHDNRIRNVFIDGLHYKGLPVRNTRTPDPWNHKETMPIGKNAVLVGTTRGAALYDGKKGMGDIRGIYVTNVTSHDAARGLAAIKGPAYDVIFLNGLHIGGHEEIIRYLEHPRHTPTDKWRHESIVSENMIRIQK